ncbi:hypothetical protein HMPREF0262_00618 [Clostridium sp. ATCC 29733]|nr:hypothetical protein HMPREF0262_00618 [Clostridium sp. ATCC 29733]
MRQHPARTPTHPLSPAKASLGSGEATAFSSQMEAQSKILPPVRVKYRAG